MTAPLITNHHGLPQTLLNLANRDRYSRGAAKISVTELIGSPRIRILRGRHAGEIVEDVADRVWSLLGSALHHVVEAGADDVHLAEERLFLDVNGWTISGGIDLQVVERSWAGDIESVALSDYKFTSAWSAMNGKADWERQLNCYAYLINQVKGWTVTGLAINAVIRDWNRHKAAQQQGYPATPIVVLPQPLWSVAEQREYLTARVKEHQDAERRDEWDEPLPECSDEERWYRPGVLAVVKPGKVRALKIFGAHEGDEARDYAAHAGAVVEVRPGENVRCDNFCAVAEWCEQRARNATNG